MFPMGMVTQRMTQGRWRSKLFTASTIWIVPADVDCLWIDGCGGGGGGGGGNSTPGGGGGGGGPAMAVRGTMLNVSPNETLTIAVGAAGTSGAANNDGGIGGNTTITGSVSGLIFNARGGRVGKAGANPNGGSGGTLPNGVNLHGGGAAAGANFAVAPFAAKGSYVPSEGVEQGFAYGGAGGALTYNGGEANGYSLTVAAPYQAGGTGGASGGGGGAGGQGPYGISGVPGSNGAAGAAPTSGYGCGGGGGSGNSAGGAGSPGMIRIYCFTAYAI